MQILHAAAGYLTLFPMLTLELVVLAHWDYFICLQLNHNILLLAQSNH